MARICICGGAAANKALREVVAARLPVQRPSRRFFLCTNNAAVFGSAAHYRLQSDGPTTLDFGSEPDLALELA